MEKNCKTKLYLNVITVHGNWGHWENLGTCSVTCGGGVQVRTRVCNNPPPTHGGNQCPGKAMEKSPCNTCACASKYETLCTPIFGLYLNGSIKLKTTVLYFSVCLCSLVWLGLLE